MCFHFLLSLYSCSFCLVFLLIILLEAQFSSANIIRLSSSNQLFLCGLSSFPISFPAAPFIPFFYFVLYFICIFYFWVLGTSAVTSLINSSFTSVLFSLPIPHFFISLFLVFSPLLVFNLILALTKKNDLILFRPLLYFSHLKHLCSVFYQPFFDLSGYILGCQVISSWPCECPYVDTMFLSQLISSQCKIYHSFSIIICFVVKAVPSTCWI